MLKLEKIKTLYYSLLTERQNYLWIQVTERTPGYYGN
jgi:hypothetical protein